MPSRNEKLWRCSCGSSHFVSITYALKDMDLDPDDNDVLSIESITWGDSLMERIRGAWKVLRGLDHCWAEVILDFEQSVEICNAMKDVVQYHIDAKKKVPHG